MATAGRERHEWTDVPEVGVPVHARVWDGPAVGPPVVLVAGLGVSSRYWIRLGPRLASHAWVIAPDLPGFGGTPPPPGVPWPAGPDAHEQADHLRAWLDARGIRRAVLFGHSVGCQTVVDFAVRFPGRVDRLILGAPVFEPGRRTLAVCLPRLAAAAVFEVPSLPPKLIYEYLSIGVVRAIQQARRTMTDRFQRQLRLVRAPTLVVHGQFDLLVSRPWAESVAGRLPRSALVVVDRVGHAMHYSAAAVTARVVHAFLRDGLTAPLSAPADDPRHDLLGPPQPIPSPVYRGMMLVIAVAVMILLGRRWPRVGWAAAVASVVGATGVPAVARASTGAMCGAGLLLAAGTALRRERPSVRFAVAMLGVGQFALALLTAKPTGPARRVAVAPPTDGEDDSQPRASYGG